MLLKTSAVKIWCFATAWVVATPLTEVKAVTGEKTFTLHCVYSCAFSYKYLIDVCYGSGLRDEW